MEPGAPPCADCRGKGVVQEEVILEEIVTPEIDRFLVSFRFFRKASVLPEPGGLNAQPATWVEAAHLLGEFLDQALDREREREEAERRKR